MDQRGNKLVSKLPIKTKFCYGVGHILNDLCASMWFSYMLLFLHKVASFNNINAGLLILIGQIADGLATPFVGIQSDRTENVRYGRRKIWHLFGVCCVTISFPFIFTLCIGHCADALQWQLMIYYTPFIVLFQFGWASTQISHLSLIPELTSDKQGKVELNAIRYFFTIMANLLIFIVCFLLFELHTKHATVDSTLSRHDAPKFKYLAISAVAIGLFFMVIFHVGIRENQQSNNIEEDRDSLVQETPEVPIVQKTILDWFKMPLFYQVGVLYMMTRLIVNVSQVYISYFVLDTLKLQKSAIAIAPAVIYVSGIFASLIAKRLNAKLGLKFTFFFGLCLIFGSSTWFYTLRALTQMHRLEVYGSAVLLGIGGSTLLINSLAIISEMIGKNTDTSAFVYGSMSFLDKITNGCAIMLIQYFHPCKNDPFCCPSCQRYYGYIMSFVPGVAAAVALLVLLSLVRTVITTTQQDELTPSKEVVDVSSSDGSVDSHPINVHVMNGGFKEK